MGKRIRGMLVGDYLVPNIREQSYCLAQMHREAGLIILKG